MQAGSQSRVPSMKTSKECLLRRKKESTASDTSDKTGRGEGQERRGK